MFRLIKCMILLGLLIMMIPIAKSQQSTTEQEIEDVVEELNGAMIELNQSKLEDLVSEELSYGHSSGLVQNKNEFIDGLMNGSFHFLTIDVSNLKIQIADDLAIVRHVLDSDYQNNQDSGHLQIGNLLILRKEDQKWKLLVRQAFKL